MTTTFACPKCNTPIEITEVMTSQLRDRLRGEVDAELAPERARLAKQASTLADERKALEMQRDSLDEQVRQQLEVERQKLTAQAREKATAELAVELRDRDEQLREAQARIKAADDRELAWRKRERDLEAREAALQSERNGLLEQSRQQIALERQKLIEEGRKKAADELVAQVRERDDELAGLREKLKSASEQELALRKRQRELEDREESLRIERAELEEQARQQLAADRQKLIEEGRRKAADELAAQVRERDEEVTGLRERLKTATEQELALRKRQRELDERAEQMQLEVDRRLDAERQQIREAACKRTGEEYELKLRDEQEKNEALRKQIDELKRRAEQGSPQAQGEALELTLEDMLREAFPADRIEEVPKGIRGGDALQRVVSPAGLDCGTILWEAKRTKNWSDSWLPKLRQDQRDAGAAAAILVSEVLPPGVTHFALVDGVWVCSRSCAMHLASAIRIGMLDVGGARRALEGQHDKMEQVYNYLVSPQFRNRAAAIVEPLIAMQEELQVEKRSFERVWAKREKQIGQAMQGVMGMYGDFQGIIGASLPEIGGMELPESADQTTKALPIATAQRLGEAAAV